MASRDVAWGTRNYFTATTPGGNAPSMGPPRWCAYKKNCSTSAASRRLMHAFLPVPALNRNRSGTNLSECPRITQHGSASRR